MANKQQIRWHNLRWISKKKNTQTVYDGPKHPDLFLEWAACWRAPTFKYWWFISMQLATHVSCKLPSKLFATVLHNLQSCFSCIRLPLTISHYHSFRQNREIFLRWRRLSESAKYKRRFQRNRMFDGFKDVFNDSKKCQWTESDASSPRSSNNDGSTAGSASL